MITPKFSRFFLATLLFVTGGLIDDAYSQETKSRSQGSHEFCSAHSNYGGDKVGHRELREFTVPASGTLRVDGERNGGISVKGGNVAEIQVRACVNAWGTTEQNARANAENIKISTSGTIVAENRSDDSNWGVSYQITVPRNTDLELTAKNGGISIAGVDGNLEFTTVNGGISLSDVSGNVRGRTANGGISISLTGSSWRGNGLDVSTTNGGVKLNLPVNYAANIEAGTVNGGYKSDIPALNITTEDEKGEWNGRHRSKQINTSINGGGAPIRVKTTNGGVKIETTDGDKKY